MNLIGDGLVDGVVQYLPLCRCCVRSFGCLDVVVDTCCCGWLVLNWKM